jgi:transcriptional regulator with PAS, ATPase and Fis domain
MPESMQCKSGIGGRLGLGIDFVVIPSPVTEGVAMKAGVKVVTSTGEVAMKARTADRRTAVFALVRQVAADLIGTNQRRHLSTILTERLGCIAGARSVRVKEISASMPTRSLQPIRARDYVAYTVPVKEPGRQVMLEAAFDPLKGPDEWTCQLIEVAANLASLLIEAERLATTPPSLSSTERDGAAPLIGSSEVMCALRDRVERVASTDFTVLIEGESGVGKELVARQIHELGRRRLGPFVAINCAALVETLIEAELFGIEERTATGVRGRRGKFEHADGGTLFLDEVSDLSMAAQAKLLRAIQDFTVERVGGNGARRINTRIVAATNRPLASLAEQGLFRTDLFYRLSGVEIDVPALRRRKGDILELTQYFLARHEGRGRLSMTPAAVDSLIAYDWPGNVRELERMLEGAIATAESRQITVDDLPVSLRGRYGDVLVPAFRLGDTMRAWGSRYARLVLEKHAGNKRQACQMLDISYHTLNAYLRYRPAPTMAPVEAGHDELSSH